jgi:hypothetical protein
MSQKWFTVCEEGDLVTAAMECPGSGVLVRTSRKVEGTFLDTLCFVPGGLLDIDEDTGMAVVFGLEMASFDEDEDDEDDDDDDDDEEEDYGDEYEEELEEDDDDDRHPDYIDPDYGDDVN